MRCGEGDTADDEVRNGMQLKVWRGRKGRGGFYMELAQEFKALIVFAEHVQC